MKKKENAEISKFLLYRAEAIIAELFFRTPSCCKTTPILGPRMNRDDHKKKMEHTLETKITQNGDATRGKEKKTFTYLFSSH